MATRQMFLYSISNGDGTYSRRLSEKGTRSQDTLVDVRQVTVTVDDAEIPTVEELKQLEIAILEGRKTDLTTRYDGRITALDARIAELGG